MQHGRKTRKFTRSCEHEKALMRNLFRSLVENKKIKTTEEKAKELKRYSEMVISRAQNDDYLKNKAMLNWVTPGFIPKVKELVKKYEGRTGGYARVIKISEHRQDAAKMAIIELV
jgi:large subunit ribosomal protein L17